jgi:hypothetical protein
MNYYGEQRQALRANLHTHSTLSDGRLAPEQVIEAYASEGYDVLAMTDHHQVNDVTQWDNRGMIVIQGAELHPLLGPDLSQAWRRGYDVDLFPDFGRQVPFGVGTSISYNYLDYRFRNRTDQTFQLIIYTDEKYLNAELRSDRQLPVKYHIESRNEHFEKEKGIWFRKGEVWRLCFDKATGNCLEEKCLKSNHARVMYDEKYIPVKN